jgi:hypothetical protein
MLAPRKRLKMSDFIMQPMQQADLPAPYYLASAFRMVASFPVLLSRLSAWLSALAFAYYYH